MATHILRPTPLTQPAGLDPTCSRGHCCHSQLALSAAAAAICWSPGVAVVVRQLPSMILAPSAQQVVVRLHVAVYPPIRLRHVMSLRLRACPRLCQRLLAVSQPTPLPNCHRVQAADAVRVVHLGAEAAHIRPHDDPTTGHVWDSDREWPKWMVVVVSSPLPSLSASSTSSLSVSLPDPCCQSPLATTSLSPAAVRTPTHCRYQPRVRPAAASHDCQGTAAGRHQHDDISTTQACSRLALCIACVESFVRLYQAVHVRLHIIMLYTRPSTPCVLLALANLTSTHVVAQHGDSRAAGQRADEHGDDYRARRR